MKSIVTKVHEAGYILKLLLDLKIIDSTIYNDAYITLKLIINDTIDKGYTGFKKTNRRII